jgi:hypothetical protein
MALTAVSMLPWPEIMITGMSVSSPLTMSSSSSPSIPPPDIQMSRISRAGLRARMAASALSPSMAVRTS